MARRSGAAAATAPDGAPTVAVLLLCGLPGAGKSALACALAARLQAEADVAVTLLSVDVEEAALAAAAGVDAPDERNRDGWHAGAWHAARERVCAAVRRAVADGALPSHPRRLLLVDDNHYYASMRRPYYTACRDARACWGVLWLDASLPAAAARNALRAGDARVREDVLLRMADRFEHPGGSAFASSHGPEPRYHHAPHHAYEARHTLRLDAAAHMPTAALLELAWPFATTQLWAPSMVPPLAADASGGGGLVGADLEAARAATAASALHAADAQLRRCVGVAIAWAAAAAVRVGTALEAGGSGHAGGEDAPAACDNRGRRYGGREDNELITSYVTTPLDGIAGVNPMSSPKHVEGPLCCGATRLPRGLQRALGMAGSDHDARGGTSPASVHPLYVTSGGSGCCHHAACTPRCLAVCRGALAAPGLAHRPDALWGRGPTATPLESDAAAVVGGAAGMAPAANAARRQLLEQLRGELQRGGGVCACPPHTPQLGGSLAPATPAPSAQLAARFACALAGALAARARGSAS